MNQLSNIPPPTFPSPVQANAPDLGGEMDSWRLAFAVVIYVAVFIWLFWYMLRKLPRRGAGGADKSSVALDAAGEDADESG